jgi:arsenite/tail-anchored protein-transporting ATPase
MRIILFTGKGGVGKTSLSAATAVACARRGTRTIVLSTDAAHSLADVLGVEIGSEPVDVEKNLVAQEINVHAELRHHWGAIRAYLKKFLASQGYQELMAEELAVMPGMEDLFALIKLLEIREEGLHDLAIIDCAPTGATLQLLGMADVLQWYMEKFYNIEKKIALAIKPIAEKIIKAPMPDKGVYASIEQIYKRLMEVRDLLSDPEISSIRIVTNPEKIVIQETQRAYTYISLFGFPVDAVLANRVIPAKAMRGYLKDWGKLQKKYMAKIESAFSPLPILKTPLFPTEMLGPDLLAQMAASAYGSLDPKAVLWKGRPFVLEGENGKYTMSINVPGVMKKDIDLWAKKSELIIKVGDFQRNFILPGSLDGHVVTKAEYSDGVFKVNFEKGV